MIRVLDLFSAAAGGWSLGMHRAGFTTMAACEFVEWRRALYSQNNPGVPVYDDVRTLTADRLVRDGHGLPDVIVGSPPCQDISSANTKGKGVEGARSGLYFDAIRLVGECRPRWFAFENSSNLRTRGADAVLAALEELGYACWSFVLATSEQITSDPDAGSSDAISNRLPTPVKPNGGRSLTVEAIETGKRANGAKAQIDTPNMLKHAFQMLPTPMASDGMKDGAGGGAGSTYPFRKILSETTKLPTPVKNDRKMEPWSEAYSRRRSPKLDALMDGASKFETLPTPTKRDKRDKRMDTWSPAYDKRKSPTMDAVLDGAMTNRSPDKWAYARQIALLLRECGLTGQSMTLPVTYNWMMGFPPGWLARALRLALQKGLLQQVSSSKRSETPSSRKSPKQ